MTRFMRALVLALAPLAAGAIKWCPAGQYRYTKCESRWCTFLCSCRTVEYCGACPAGQTSSGHTTNCARAERGQYLYKSGHTMGVGNCPAGQFQDRTNQYSCRSCGPGYYSPGARSASCTPCNAGDYQPNFGQSSCSPCAAGYISSSRSSTCTPCAPGRYEAGNACHECDAGKFSSEASTSCSLCEPQCTINFAALPVVCRT